MQLTYSPLIPSNVFSM